MKKTIAIVIFVVVILFSAFFLASYHGLPWKKTSTGNELKKYVEDKYEISVSIKENYFNTKGGTYGTTFVADGNKNITFNADKYKDRYTDYYAEALWVNEASDDLKPVIEDSFATLSIQDYGVHPVYGIGHDLKVGKEVPSYKEVKTGVELSIHFKDAWTEENEEKLITEVAAFIEKAHSKGIKNISMRFYLQDKVMEDGRTNTFSISIEDVDLSTIKTEEDVKKYINTF